MKVKELIEQLRSFDPETYCYYEVDSEDTGSLRIIGDLTTGRVYSTENGAVFVDILNGVEQRSDAENKEICIIGE